MCAHANEHHDIKTKSRIFCYVKVKQWVDFTKRQNDAKNFTLLNKVKTFIK